MVTAAATNTTMKRFANKAKTTQIEQIAKRHLFVDTLREAKRGGQDFHEIAVWNIKEALEAAYAAGAASAQCH